VALNTSSQKIIASNAVKVNLIRQVGKTVMAMVVRVINLMGGVQTVVLYRARNGLAALPTISLTKIAWYAAKK